MCVSECDYRFGWVHNSYWVCGVSLRRSPTPVSNNTISLCTGFCVPLYISNAKILSNSKPTNPMNGPKPLASIHLCQEGMKASTSDRIQSIIIVEQYILEQEILPYKNLMSQGCVEGRHAVKYKQTTSGLRQGITVAKSR